MPIRSKHADVVIPDVDTWTLLFERKNRPFRDDKVIFHDTISPREYTYAHIKGSAIGFGQSLRSSWNWQKGDVLAIYSPNDVDYATIVFGTHWAGGIVTTANPGYTVDELAHQLVDSKAKAIVTQAPLLKTTLAAARKAGVRENRVILIGPDTIDTPVPHYTSLSGYRVYDANQHVPRPYRINPNEDLCFLVYSSGTTGKPKGVMLSHRNIVSNVLMLTRPNEGYLSCGDGTTGSGDRTIGFLPLFHIYGLTGVLHYSLHQGIELFILPTFTLSAFLNLVQTHRITYNNVVPRIILALAKDPSVANYDLSSLKMLVSAAAPLTKDLVDLLYDRLKIPVKQAFGLSETSPGTHQQEWDEWNVGIGSIGRPAPNVETKIVDVGNLSEVDPNEVGELWVRGPNVFKGYLNNEKATREALTSDGWFRTGDVGYVDERGLCFITDRIKELIKFNGFQVAPAELEGLLTSHPTIKDAAVIGVYSKELATELPRAYVVLDGGIDKSSTTADEIATWLSERVAKHKRLRGGVRFINAIPSSATGKILRRELKVLAEKEGEAKAKL
ncbi:hypothetical protein M409DRAFT_66041 [Zasmidium cellare ATCC 36951]|uniref:Acetyl-CoA synthetase-like protein n=1 Tax=Zasmidium cellare ATCC 36951 TaxID=1080233 RepID=A0A6A6CNI6_ZASCE|nr:uncharacterized protein M409DRAFT_66041 [Zasmidium cellare ATCC 36951]KAF2167482.1 hypothetical protein M409DRAFT_66041 [Zasmidium cellare ATCC 36951]